MSSRNAISRGEEDRRVDLTTYLDRLVPPVSETAYEMMAGYGFARRYVGGKRVADLCWREMGHGSRLLAGTAESVTGMAFSAESAEVASKALSAPNVGYEAVGLSGLPYPDGHFDVVVALGLIEHHDRPEELLAEARRVLGAAGILVVSFPEGRAPNDNGRHGFRGLLERHFEQVRAYRQGAVSGGIVFPSSGETGETLLESVSLSPAFPHPGAEAPAARSVLAVCSSDGRLEESEQPYLLLDRDRRVFDECADRAEDVENLRGEIENMQRTEVQAFRDSLKLRNSEISYLRARIRNQEAHLRTQIQAQIRNQETQIRNQETQIRNQETQIRNQETQIRHLKQQIYDMENSTTWRVFEPYRRLRAKLDGVKGYARWGAKGKEHNRQD